MWLFQESHLLVHSVDTSENSSRLLVKYRVDTDKNDMYLNRLRFV